MAFKTMEWIRKVRDEDYRQCKKMNAKDKIEHTRAAAKKLTAKKKSAAASRKNFGVTVSRPS